MLMNGSNSNTKDKRCVHPNAPALHYLRRTRTRFTPIARSVHADVLYHTYFILTLSLHIVIQVRATCTVGLWRARERANRVRSRGFERAICTRAARPPANARLLGT